MEERSGAYKMHFLRRLDFGDRDLMWNVYAKNCYGRKADKWGGSKSPSTLSSLSRELQIEASLHFEDGTVES